MNTSNIQVQRVQSKGLKPAGSAERGAAGAPLGANVEGGGGSGAERRSAGIAAGAAAAGAGAEALPLVAEKPGRSGGEAAAEAAGTAAAGF